MQLTFGELIFIIDYLESLADGFVSQMGATEDERKQFYEKAMKLKGEEISTNADFSDESISNEIAEPYNKLIKIIEKLKKVREANVSELLNILFPFRDTRPPDCGHSATEEEVKEKKQMMLDFLSSNKNKISESHFLGDTFLVGIKYLNSKEPKISIYECKDFLRHDFLLT